MLKGKNAIITGARRGIGRATVEVFAENGANIWACARKEDAAFEADMIALVKRYGVWIKPLYFDLLDEHAIKSAIIQIQKQNQKIDILVNNAGTFQLSAFYMTSISTLKETFQTNFFAQILIMQLVARSMMKQKEGTIVNVSSVAGMDGKGATLAYGSSKAALAYATKAAAKDLSPYRIRVNAVAPGYIQTAMGDQLPDTAQETFITQSSLGRPGNAREVANSILYLSSEMSSFVTGQILRIDGGL